MKAAIPRNQLIMWPTPRKLKRSSIRSTLMQLELEEGVMSWPSSAWHDFLLFSTFFPRQFPFLVYIYDSSRSRDIFDIWCEIVSDSLFCNVVFDVASLLYISWVKSPLEKQDLTSSSIHLLPTPSTSPGPSSPKCTSNSSLPVPSSHLYLSLTR